jgi:hypothetical protein
MWEWIANLHCYPREAEEIKLEEADHDLIVLIHGFESSDKDFFRCMYVNNALFILGLAPTTWNMAQL